MIKYGDTFGLASKYSKKEQKTIKRIQSRINCRLQLIVTEKFTLFFYFYLISLIYIIRHISWNSNAIRAELWSWHRKFKVSQGRFQSNEGPPCFKSFVSERLPSASSIPQATFKSHHLPSSPSIKFLENHHTANIRIKERMVCHIPGSVPVTVLRDLKGALKKC